MAQQTATFEQRALPRKAVPHRSLATGLRVFAMSVLLCWAVGAVIGALRHDLHRQIATACREAYARGLREGRVEGRRLATELAPTHCMRWGAWGPSKTVICQEPRHEAQ